MGSNKSAQVSAPAISADIKKWVTWIIIGVAIVFTLSYIISTVRKDYKQKQSEKVLAAGQAQITAKITPVWTKIDLPPIKGGKSRLPQMTEPDIHVWVKGYHANIHTVYMDGHEAVLPVESTESNPSGPVDYEYVTNELNGPNTVSYIIVPIHKQM